MGLSAAPSSLGLGREDAKKGGTTSSSEIPPMIQTSDSAGTYESLLGFVGTWLR